MTKPSDISKRAWAGVSAPVTGQPSERSVGSLGATPPRATRVLRQLPLPAQPWVVAMTANAFEEDRRACLAAGMNDFVSKPATVTTLRSAFTRFLESR